MRLSRHPERCGVSARAEKLFERLGGYYRRLAGKIAAHVGRSVTPHQPSILQERNDRRLVTRRAQGYHLKRPVAAANDAQQGRGCKSICPAFRWQRTRDSLLWQAHSSPYGFDLVEKLGQLHRSPPLSTRVMDLRGGGCVAMPSAAQLISRIDPAATV